jgi:hypothetical protein
LHIPQPLRLLHQFHLPIDVLLRRLNGLFGLLLETVGLFEAALPILLLFLLSFLQLLLDFLLFLLDLLVGNLLHFGFFVLVHGGCRLPARLRLRGRLAALCRRRHLSGHDHFLVLQGLDDRPGRRIVREDDFPVFVRITIELRRGVTGRQQDTDPGRNKGHKQNSRKALCHLDLSIRFDKKASLHVIDRNGNFL